MRLADRLGLLAGPDLSPAAMFGVRLLMYADQMARAKDADRQLRLALVARGADPAVLFPEVFASAPAAGPEPEADDELQDVEWKVPAGTSEWAAVAEALAQRTVSIRPVASDEGWV